MAGMMDAQSMFMLANETHPETKFQTYDAADMFRRAVRTARAVPDVPTSYLLSGFARAFKNVIAGRGKCRKKAKSPCTYAPRRYETATSTTASLSVRTAR